eukprot:7158381-Pyramimonas_sp.AAC.1
MGALIDARRRRLPATENILIETIRASHGTTWTRRRDQQCSPPGRARTFGLIIYDEAPQIQDYVWDDMQIAIGELTAGPFVRSVGDFQRLQPVGDQRST